MTVRVRFAPSPTGYLHIGGARTALFNWLFARHMGGTFILRIEDTDEARSTESSVSAILNGMSWLNLDWDEGPTADGSGTIGANGPYFQMQRLDLYKKYADQLVCEGKAYACYCSPAELEAMRTKALLEKRSPKYDGRCRNLTDAKRREYESEGRKPVIRFHLEASGAVIFNDLLRGTVRVDHEQLDDFVLIKASGVPTYQFAVVVDDYLMRITHIIRGDDHLSNTPRQILVMQALGWNAFLENVKFAHLSMILGADGSRLSKRHGATSVEEYAKQGYLPDAMINYLALLGWSTEESQQLFENRQELIQKFSLERCSKSPAVFDPEKLLWMNGEHLRKLPAQKFVEWAAPFLAESGLDHAGKSADYLARCVALEQEKVKLLTEVPGKVDFMVRSEIDYDSESVEKVLRTAGVDDLLGGIASELAALDIFSAEKIEQACRAFAKTKGVKTGQIFHPLRVATSGRTQGPSLFHYLEILGRGVVLARIQNTRTQFSTR